MRVTSFITTMAFASLALGTALPNGADLVDRAQVKAPAKVQAPAKAPTSAKVQVPAKAPASAKVPAPSKTPAAAPLVAGTGPFKRIKAPQVAWDHVQAACARGKKRGLESRDAPDGFLPVTQGENNGMGPLPFGLYTEGLVTCFGIVIRGTAPASNPNANTRWLLHMQATRISGDWDRFKTRVTNAGLTDMTGYMSLPSPAAVGTRIGPFAWSEADQVLSNKMIEEMKAEVQTLTRRAPIVHMRPMEPPSSMQISATGEVRAGNTVL